MAGTGVPSGTGVLERKRVSWVETGRNEPDRLFEDDVEDDVFGSSTVAVATQVAVR